MLTKFLGASKLATKNAVTTITHPPNTGWQNGHQSKFPSNFLSSIESLFPARNAEEDDSRLKKCKGESVVAAMLLSSMEVSHCTCCMRYCTS